MRLRKPPHPLTPEEIRERNVRRIMNPPRRTLWDRIRGVAWEVAERQDSPDPADMLRRLRSEFVQRTGWAGP